MPGARKPRALVRTLGYLRGRRLRIAAGLVATVASSLLGAAQPLLMRSVVDEAIPHQRWGLLVLLTVGLALVPFARLGLGTLQTLWINGTAQRIARELRVQLVDHLLRMPLPFYNVNKTGEIMSRVTRDCGRLAGFVSGTGWGGFSRLRSRSCVGEGHRAPAGSSRT
jgi:ATP-binding cassette subfamily B protein